MDNILGLILTSLSIIGILVSGAVWVMVQVSRVTSKVISAERDIIELKKDVEKLEQKTSYEHLEEVTKRVMLQVVHSEDFKKSIRDVLLHIERNKSIAEASAFTEILNRLDQIEKYNHD